MSPLLRVALWTCPGEYRREYGESIARDVASRRLDLLVSALDVFYQGVAMRSESAVRDLRWGARQLVRTPVFAAIAVLTIALGIGANVAAGSIVRGILLQPLPFTQPDRLAFIDVASSDGTTQPNIDYPDVADIARLNRTFSSIAAVTKVQGILTGIGAPETLNGRSVSAHYFPALGATAQLGRLLSVGDLGTHNIVVSDRLWRATLGGTPAVLGRTLTLDSRHDVVVGVAQPGLYDAGPGYLSKPDYWTALNPRAHDAAWRGHYSWYAIGRLQPGITVEAAGRDLARIASLLAAKYPHFDTGHGLSAKPITDVIIGPMRDLILVMYGASLVVLLIAGANIANLLLARATAREHDLAVRAAVGATRRRLAMQLTAEAALFTCAGSVVGIALGWLGLVWIGDTVVTGFSAIYGTTIPGWDRVHIDAPLLLYIVAIAALFTIVVGTLPVFIRGTGLAKRLNGAGRSDAATGARVRGALVIGELALAFALLVAGGLIVRSFFLLEHTSPGYAEADRFAVYVDMPPRIDRILLFGNRLVAKLDALPGIRGAAEGDEIGVGSTDSTNFSVTQTADLQMKTGSVTPTVEFNSVSPEFFDVLGIPLLRGRTFKERDGEKAQPVAIVSASFALQEFHTLDALGRHVSVGESSGGGFPLRTIVGVVGDVRHSLAERPAPEVYVPFAQVSFYGSFVVHTAGSLPGLAKNVDAAVSQIDPLLPSPQIVSFRELRGLDTAVIRIGSQVLGLLAVVALILALGGIYGVLSYTCERRTHEFGIRMAVGARAQRVVFSVLKGALLSAAIGIAVGAVIATLLSSALGQYLYETSAFDPTAFVGAAVLLAVATVLAALVPAVRATSVDPVKALRYE